jgi:hypothetical protein
MSSNQDAIVSRTQEMGLQAGLWRKQGAADLSDFASLLVHYHYQSRAQQLDIVRLLYLAGAFDSETLRHDLEATGHAAGVIDAALKIAADATQSHQESKNIEKFDAELVLDKLFYSQFPTSGSSTWPEKIHHWLLLITQREFFARPKGQERWQQETGLWIQQNEKEIRTLVKNLRLENSVLPRLGSYRAICPLGSTAPEMKKRLLFTKRILDGMTTTEQLYPLTGERYAEKVADNAEHLVKVSEHYQIAPESLIETHLMRFALEESELTVPCTIIHTPRGEKPRPTTIDTLIELARQVPALEGDVLFISGAPNIAAQREDIIATAKIHLPHIRVEVVGECCENLTLNRILGALGGTLFGGYPRVALEMGCEKSVAELESARLDFSFSAQQKRVQSKMTPVF